LPCTVVLATIQVSSETIWLGAINYDTGNVAVVGNDSVETLKAVVEHLKHMHLKDIVREKTAGYEGCFSIEYRLNPNWRYRFKRISRPNAITPCPGDRRATTSAHACRLSVRYPTQQEGSASVNCHAIYQFNYRNTRDGRRIDKQQQGTNKW